MKIKIISLLMLQALVGCSTVGINNKELESKVIKADFDNSQVLNQKNVDLKKFWEQFNSSGLNELIAAAQDKSPDIYSALINIKSYENTAYSYQSKNRPNVSMTSSVSKSINKSDSNTYSTSRDIGFQTSWELDLFNKNGLNQKSNQLLSQGAKASWHDARVLIAANTAKSYFTYQMCQSNLDLLRQDLKAKEDQDKITKLNVDAGLESKSSQYLSEATVYTAKQSIITQEISCVTEKKGLVALTGLNEEKVSTILKKEPNFDLKISIPQMVPGQLLEQRPDVYNAKKELEAQLLTEKSVSLEKYPTISFSGNIGLSSSVTNSVTTNGKTIGIGPLSISLPIFDNGEQKRKEELYSMKTQYAQLTLENNVRTAVKEVEVLLASLARDNETRELLEKAKVNYEKSYEATLEKYKVGISSLYELQTDKSSYLNSQISQNNYKTQTITNWIDLYKAVGGGFKGEEE